MPTFDRLISIARPYLGRLLLVAVLTSAGALAELVEPWVYRAIINDIAGVFVSKATGLWPEVVEELRGGEPEVPEPAPAGTPTGPGPAVTPMTPAPSRCRSPQPSSAPPA